MQLSEEKSAFSLMQGISLLMQTRQNHCHVRQITQGSESRLQNNISCSSSFIFRKHMIKLAK